MLEILGINLKAVHCPQCDERLPTLRLPSLSQVAWGGWTCPQCGCEVDKWGRAVREDESEMGHS
jgi:hypothetical protein